MKRRSALAGALVLALASRAHAETWRELYTESTFANLDADGAEAVGFGDALQHRALSGGAWVVTSTTPWPDIQGLVLSGGGLLVTDSNAAVTPLRPNGAGWIAEPVLYQGANGPTVVAAGSSAVVLDSGNLHFFERVMDQWVASSVMPLPGTVGLSFDGATLSACTGASVRVFRRDGGGWSEDAPILGGFPCGAFCLDAPVSGDRITVAGCQLQDYVRQGSTWAPEGPPLPLDRLYPASAVAGDVLALGASGAQPAGVVEVFRRGPAGWALSATIEPKPGAYLFGGRLDWASGWLFVRSATATHIFAPIGEACVAPDACPTAHCVDGVCCDAACDASCDACDAPGAEGHCTRIAGAPHGDRPACEPAPSCAGEIRDPGGHCDGASAQCVPGAPVSCAPYRCRDGACTAPCTDSADCEDEHRCAAGVCLPDATVCDGDAIVHVDGVREACAPYRCSDAGVCLRRCGSSEECVAGFVCDAGGACISGAAIDPPSDGCRAAPVAAGERGRLAALLLLALSATWWRARGARARRGPAPPTRSGRRSGRASAGPSARSTRARSRSRSSRGARPRSAGRSPERSRRP